MDSRLAALDLAHPANRGVLARLRANELALGVPMARPSAVRDPYLERGSHPDVVQRVWDELGRGLPRASRALVYGSVALVHAQAGIVLAVAFGTAYALRAPAVLLAEVEAAGLSAIHTCGGSSSSVEAFGPLWRFGAWHAREPDWARAAHDEL
ncbi:MAG: hypothetical protein JNK02_12220 [Planctomycetes bacterium]|nr:hypothetical protein [Planctomycetota bacterium]